MHLPRPVFLDTPPRPPPPCSPLHYPLFCFPSVCLSNLLQACFTECPQASLDASGHSPHSRGPPFSPWPLVLSSLSSSALAPIRVHPGPHFHPPAPSWGPGPPSALRTGPLRRLCLHHRPRLRCLWHHFFSALDWMLLAVTQVFAFSPECGCAGPASLQPLRVSPLLLNTRSHTRTCMHTHTRSHTCVCAPSSP